MNITRQDRLEDLEPMALPIRARGFGRTVAVCAAASCFATLLMIYSVAEMREKTESGFGWFIVKGHQFLLVVALDAIARS